MTTTTIGQLTELQANGGGYFTESYPTNFHHFYTKKALVTGETIDMFKDVTASEKATIEAADAKWVEPSADLIVAAEAAGATYNAATGFFELNTLTDLTAYDVEQILTFGMFPIMTNMGHNLPTIRTNIPVDNASGYVTHELSRAFFGCAKLEVANVWHCGYNITSATYLFNNCPRLKAVIGDIIHLRRPFTTTNMATNFARLPALETIQIKTEVSLSIPDSPLLSLDSLTYMVDNAANNAPITITLHPTAYARITPELFSAAAAKQVTFATIQE